MHFSRISYSLSRNLQCIGREWKEIANTQVEAWPMTPKISFFSRLKSPRVPMYMRNDNPAVEAIIAHNDLGIINFVIGNESRRRRNGN